MGVSDDLPPPSVVRVGDLGDHYPGGSPRAGLFWVCPFEDVESEMERARPSVVSLTAMGYGSEQSYSLHYFWDENAAVLRVLTWVRKPLSEDAGKIMEGLGFQVQWPGEAN